MLKLIRKLKFAQELEEKEQESEKKIILIGFN